jgi:chitodextrinase/putative cell wall-binding protein
VSHPILASARIAVLALLTAVALLMSLLVPLPAAAAAAVADEGEPAADVTLLTMTLAPDRLEEGYERPVEIQLRAPDGRFLEGTTTVQIEDGAGRPLLPEPLEPAVLAADLAVLQLVEPLAAGQYLLRAHTLHAGELDERVGRLVVDPPADMGALRTSAAEAGSSSFTSGWLDPTFVGAGHPTPLPITASFSEPILEPGTEVTIVGYDAMTGEPDASVRYPGVAGSYAHIDDQNATFELVGQLPHDAEAGGQDLYAEFLTPSGTLGYAYLAATQPFASVDPVVLASGDVAGASLGVQGVYTWFDQDETTVRVLTTDDQGDSVEVAGAVGAITVESHARLDFTLTAELPSGFYTVVTETRGVAATAFFFVDDPSMVLSESFLPRGYDGRALEAYGYLTDFDSSTVLSLHAASGDVVPGAFSDVVVQSEDLIDFHLEPGLPVGEYTVRATTGARVVETPLVIFTPGIFSYPGFLVTGHGVGTPFEVYGSGTRFTTGAVVEVLDPAGAVVAGAVDDLVVIDDQQLTFTLAVELPEGVHTIRVTDAAGIHETEVTVSAPFISAWPSFLEVGYAPTQVEVYGWETRFAQGTTQVEILNRIGDPVTPDKVSDVQVVDPQHLTFDLASGLPTGRFTIRVTTGTQVSETTFGVFGGYAYLEPSYLLAGYATPQAIRVEGFDTHFVDGVTRALLRDPATDAIVDGATGPVTVTSPTAASFSLLASLDTGSYVVDIVTGDEHVETYLYVDPGSITITPSELLLGYDTPVDIAVSGLGTAFDAGTTVQVFDWSSNGDEVVDGTGAVVVTSPTQLSFQLLAALPAGWHEIRVTDDNGTYSANLLVTEPFAFASPSGVEAGYGLPYNVLIDGFGVDWQPGAVGVELLDGADGVIAGALGDVEVRFVDQLRVPLVTALPPGAYTFRITDSVASPPQVLLASFFVTAPEVGISLSPPSLMEGYAAPRTIAVSGRSTDFGAGTTVEVVGEAGAAGTPTITSATALSFALTRTLAPGDYVVRVVDGSATHEAGLRVAARVPGVVDNGVIQLGVHPEGHLNIQGDLPSLGGTSAVGLRYLPTGAEATAPGCLCEGWGVADTTTRRSGYANVSTDGVVNLDRVAFTTTATTATSVVDVAGADLRVTHLYRPSPVTPNLYEAVVTVRNTGSAAADLRYRRVMDWDIEPTAFNEYVTISGTGEASPLFFSNNGFETANPLGPQSDLGMRGTSTAHFFTDHGPSDHGALFDLYFGELPAGESESFTIYYGAAGSAAAAQATVDAVGANVWSFGKPSTAGNPDSGEPNTFIFAFSTAGDGDGVAPTWDDGAELRATDIGDTSVTLGWDAVATDNIGVVTYEVFRDGASIGTVDAGDDLVFPVTGLEPLTTYAFSVEALDAAGNRSTDGPQREVRTTGVDGVAPTWPDGSTLTASDIAATSLSLSWTAAADNVGVTGYRVLRDGVQVGDDLPSTPRTTQVTGLAPGTAYTFTVEALDEAGNVSTTGPSTEATTLEVADEEAPTWPGGALAVDETTVSSVSLSWSSAVDNVGVTGYLVFVEGVVEPVASTSAGTRTATISGLSAGVEYVFSVQARDAAGNVSADGPSVVATTPADTTAPTWPGGAVLTFSAVGATSLTFSWPAASDDVGVDGYAVFRRNAEGAFVQIGTTPPGSRSFTDAGRTSGVLYAYKVEAFDAADNVSTTGPQGSQRTTDVVAPTWPDGSSVTASSVTGSSVSLSWTAASDNVAVAGYRVFRDGVQVGIDRPVTPRTFEVTGLTPATGYAFRVEAIDAAGNVSTTGPTTSATTLDTVAPSWPSGSSLTASSVTGSSVSLSWTAASDNVGVTGYRVFRDGVQVGGDLPASPRTLSVTGLSDATTYAFRVEAIDAAGNVSTTGPTTSATTTDTTAPTWSGGVLSVVGSTVSSLSLSWSSAVDNVGVTGYLVFVEGVVEPVASTSAGTRTATISGLSAGVEYVFSVQARDAAGNVSADGPSVVATTPADTTAPTWPGGAVLTFSAVGATSLTFSWPAASDDVGVDGYAVFRRNAEGAFVQIGTTPPGSRSFTDAGRTSGVLYAYKVEAFDAADNVSTTGPQGSQRTTDVVAPTWPEGASITFSGVTATQIGLAWPAASDNVGIATYRVMRRAGTAEFAEVASIPAGTRTFADSGLTPGTSYTYRLDAVDAAGNRASGPQGTQATVSLDAAPPAWPSTRNLVERNLAQTTVRLAWTQATDNVAVTGYRVFRGTTLIGSTPPDVRVIDVAGLTAGTRYTFSVQAIDAAGNQSTDGPSLTIETPAASDATPVAISEEEVETGDSETVHTLPIGPVTVTLGNVSSGGSAVVEQIDGDPAGDTAGLKLLPTSFEVRLTNVQFDTARVCFSYTDAQVAAAGLVEADLRLFHFVTNPSNPSGPLVPVDVTTSHDRVRNVICGVTDSFSPFAIGIDTRPARSGVDRLFGSGRVETAAAISAASFAPGVPVAYVATAGNFPDALTGGPAAGRRGGPVLLTAGDALHAATRAELQRLRPAAIVVLGGEGAVPASVAAELGALTSGEVTRLRGNDRFATAAAISAAHFDPGVPVAYVATGANFPDALAGGPAAFVQDGPVLLVNKDGIPDATLAELRRLGPARIVVLGGLGVVADAVEVELRGLAGAGGVTRLFGSGRYDTAAAITRSAFTATGGTVFVATGGNFPDALAGAPAAALDRAPLLLVEKSSIPAPIADELRRLAPSRIVLLGGSSAIDAVVERALGDFVVAP